MYDLLRRVRIDVARDRRIAYLEACGFLWHSLKAVPRDPRRVQRLHTEVRYLLSLGHLRLDAEPALRFSRSWRQPSRNETSVYCRPRPPPPPPPPPRDSPPPAGCCLCTTCWACCVCFCSNCCVCCWCFCSNCCVLAGSTFCFASC